MSKLAQNEISALNSLLWGPTHVLHAAAFVWVAATVFGLTVPYLLCVAVVLVVRASQIGRLQRTKLSDCSPVPYDTLSTVVAHGFVSHLAYLPLWSLLGLIGLLV